MDKALLVIGGNRLQCPALGFAREAGLRTVVADGDQRSPGRRLAHEFHPIPGHDVEALVALARRLAKNGRLAGVHAAHEHDLRALAAVGSATGVPAPGPEAVQIALDRPRARELWRKRGIPCQDLGPGQRAGARYLDVNGFFRDGVFVPAGLSERFLAPPPLGIAQWVVQPPALSADEQRAIYELVERAARALGIESGPIGADLLRSDASLSVRALLPCFRDPLTTAFVTPLAHGKSPLQSWFATLAGAGGPFDEMPLAIRAHAGWMAILPERPGVLVGIEGIERARSVPGIVDLLVRDAGHEIPSLSDERAVCGTLWGQAETRVELEYRLRSAREALEVHIAWRKAA